MKYNILLVTLLYIFICSGQNTSFEGLVYGKLLDSEGNAFYIETKLPRGGRIWSLDWSPDDAYIAVGNATGLIRIYDAETLRLDKVLSGINSTINSIHFSPDAKKIGASGGNGEVAVWDLPTMESHALAGHKAQVRNLRWSPSGNFLATTSHDGFIKMWDNNYNLVQEIHIPRGGCVGIDWLDDNTIGASCWDNTVRVFDLKEERHLIFANGVQSKKAVLSVDWHPSGEFLATGDYGNRYDSSNNVVFWSPNGEMQRKMTLHSNGIRALLWNPNGALLATGGETIRLWDKEGNLIRAINANNSPIWSMDWNSRGDRIVSGHNDGKVRIWDANGKLLSILNGHATEITAHSFSKDSTMLILGFADGEIRFYDLKNMTSSSYKKHSRSITDIAWSNSGKHVAFTSNDTKGSIWKVNNKGLTKPVFLRGHEHNLNAIVWSPDDKKIAIGGYENKIHKTKKLGFPLYVFCASCP